MQQINEFLAWVFGSGLRMGLVLIALLILIGAIGITAGLILQ